VVVETADLLVPDILAGQVAVLQIQAAVEVVALMRLH
jgi:hypothetical protein